jgi:hypothetical protein
MNLSNLYDLITNSKRELDKVTLIYNYYITEKQNKEVTQVSELEIQETLISYTDKIKKLINKWRPLEVSRVCFSLNPTKNLSMPNKEVAYTSRKRKRSVSTAQQTPGNIETSEKINAFCEKVKFPYEVTELFLTNLSQKIKDSINITPENHLSILTSLYSKLAINRKHLLFHLEGGHNFYDDFFKLLKRHFPEGYIWNASNSFHFGGTYFIKVQTKELFEELRIFLDGKCGYNLTIYEYYYLEDIYNKMISWAAPFRMKDVKYTAKLFKDLEIMIKQH